MTSCLKSPAAVAFGLFMELKKMGFYLEYNRSLKSGDSWYIKIGLGTVKAPKAVHIRISDHDVQPQYRETVRYNFDICASHLRENAITYIDFLRHFAFQTGKTVPKNIINLSSGTQAYEKYICSLK
jgi:hypothetical protein